MKKLHCHTNERGIATIGKVYNVIRETPEIYEIVDDSGREALFTKKPDADGLSYKTWFTVLDDSEPASRWQVHVQLPNGCGGKLSETRYFAEYSFALDYALETAMTYNNVGLHDVTPLRSNMRGALSFRIEGKDGDDFVGGIHLEAEVVQ